MGVNRLVVSGGLEEGDEAVELDDGPSVERLLPIAEHPASPATPTLPPNWRRRRRVTVRGACWSLMVAVGGALVLSKIAFDGRKSLASL